MKRRVARKPAENRAVSAKNRRRRGAFSVQLIFIVPVLVLVLIAAVQYGLWSVARQTVASATIDGARVAAGNGSNKEIVKAVAKSLSANKMRLDSRRAVIVIERYGRAPDYLGNRSLIKRLYGPKLRPGEIRVTVCLLPGARAPVWLRWSKREPQMRSSSLLAAN